MGKLEDFEAGLRKRADSIAYEMAGEYIFRELREYYAIEGNFDDKHCFFAGELELIDLLRFLGGSIGDIEFHVEAYRKLYKDWMENKWNAPATR